MEVDMEEAQSSIPESPAGQSSRAEQWPDAVALTVALGALGLYLASELFLFSGSLGFPLDDSWIHLQFAKNLAAGEGLSYHPGRIVAGSTGPLWTALLALGFLGPGAPLVWAKLLGAGCYLATVDATSRLVRELGMGFGLARLAAISVAASHWLVWSALSGMEVLLFTTLTLWGTIFHLRERHDPGRPPVALAVLGLACLARPEGFLLLAAAVADRLFGRLPPGGNARRAAIRGLVLGIGAALVVAVPTFLFYRLAAESFLPTTFAVKGGSAPDLLPSGRYLRTVLDVLFGAQPILLLFAGAGVLRLAEGLGGPRDRGLLPAFWLLGLPLVASLLAPEGGAPVVGNFGRYFFPLLPFVVVCGMLGLKRVARRLEDAPRWLPVGLVAVLLLPQAFGLLTGPVRYTQTIANVEASDVAAARWLAGRVPPEALLAVQDVGALKYHLLNPVLDLAGIVNPEILPHLKGTGVKGSGAEAEIYWEERLRGFLAERRPAYLIVFPSSYPGLVRSPGFRPLKRFPIPQNVTMAGDELVIFSTPWTGSQNLREPGSP